MWIFIPTMYLAVIQIAGGNLAIVPDGAALLPGGIFLTTVVAFLGIGSLVSVLNAWIGVKTGEELIMAAKSLYGCKGKRAAAVLIMIVSIPASAITGGCYGGLLLNRCTDIPYWLALPVALIIFSVMAMDFNREILRTLNYLAVMVVLFIIYTVGKVIPGGENGFCYWGEVNWLLVLALVAYNSGGMRAAFVVETAAGMRKKKYWVVLLVILANLLEGIVAVLMAGLVVKTGAAGPLALINTMKIVFGEVIVKYLNIVLLIIFGGTMAPAMIVNAKQISVLCGLSWPTSFIVAYLLVYLFSLLGTEVILRVLSFSGLVTIFFVMYLAYNLYKYSVKQT